MATVYYKRDTNPTNNSWAQANNWSTVSSTSATNTGTYPVATDTATFDASSIQVTIGSAAACATLDCTGYTNTITFSANLTITANSNFGSGMSTSGTAGYLIIGGSLTFTSNAVVLTTTLTIGAYTLTLADDFTVGQLLLTGTCVINGSYNLKVNGSQSGNYACSGAATIVFQGTLSSHIISNTNTTGFTCPITINCSGTYTVSTFYMSGSFTMEAGTLTGSGAPGLAFSNTTTIAHNGGTISSYIAFTAAVTYTLSTDVTITGSGGVYYTNNGAVIATNTLTAPTLLIGAALTLPKTNLAFTNMATSSTQTVTLASDVTVPGNVLGQAMVLSGAYNLNVGGNLTHNSAISSSNSTIVMNGTGNWTGTTALNCDLTINTAGAVVMNGNVTFGGNNNPVLTVTTPATFSVAGTYVLTLSNSGMNTSTFVWPLVTLTAGDVALTSNLNITTMTANGALSCYFAGNYDVTIANLRGNSSSNNASIALPTGRTLNITNSLKISTVPGGVGYTYTLKGGTVGSPATAYLNYSGTAANCQVVGVTFTDIDASSSSMLITNYNGGTLTRTINILNTTQADMRQVGCWGAGSVAANTAQARSGTCVALTPTSATDPYYWTFLVPTTASTAFTLKFWHRITASFDGTMTLTVYDTDNTTKLVNAASVTFTDDGAYHQFTSASITPTATGFCRCVLKLLFGTAGTAVYIDDVST